MDINIAFGVTKNWFLVARVAIASVLLTSNPEDNYNFYILCDEFDDKDKFIFDLLKKIRQAEFHFIKMNDDDFKGLTLFIGSCAYYRLRIPSLIDLDKVLYMDADMICTKNIAEIYSTDISDYYIGATEDVLSEHWGKKLGFDYETEPYINSGLLLMNLKKFREDNLEKLFFEKLHIEKNYWDQDVINYVCKNKILQFPIRYNCMPIGEFRILDGIKYTCYRKRKEEYNQAVNTPFIIHFSFKPWAHPKLLYANIWFEIKKYVDSLINY